MTCLLAEVVGNNKPNTLVSLAFGAAAGAAGQTASYPLDIVRRRMQTMRVNTAGGDRYPTILETLVKIYRCVQIFVNDFIHILIAILITISKQWGGRQERFLQGT